jgi:CheY-like chemotaxis protein
MEGDMNRLRILHVDDDPDIREVVLLSLALDPAFSVRSCASGTEALAAVAHWFPDMILCDVMMPVMNGLVTLARLRERPQTAETPVVFMTARAQSREIERFKSLGVNGVIAKPFDPMTLADCVRCHLRSARFATARNGFVGRMQADVARLAEWGESLRGEATLVPLLERIKVLAHGLVGSAGVFGFEEVSCAACALETAVIDGLAGDGSLRRVEGDLKALVDCIEHAQSDTVLMPMPSQSPR